MVSPCLVPFWVVSVVSRWQGLMTWKMKEVPLRWNKNMVYLQQWIGHWSLLPMILGFTSAQPMSFHLHFIHLKAWEPEHFCFIQSFWDGSVMQHLAVWKGGYPKTSTTESASSELSSQLQAAEDMQTSTVGSDFGELWTISVARMGDNNKKTSCRASNRTFVWRIWIQENRAASGFAFLFFWGGGRFEPSHHVFKPKDKAMRLEQLLEAATAREATMGRSNLWKIVVPKKCEAANIWR